MLLQVKVHYIGRLTKTGKVFDRTNKQPFGFKLGTNRYHLIFNIQYLYLMFNIPHLMNPHVTSSRSAISWV